ncbi:hypothetical protein BpHYR1_035424 [Brachionus plicatilis]|uniref:Uncharacterized protein n=1 Tax=Brachionus plicatilis TaxID=10195 RepID=A0A3M7QF30_BRAPC|nr:hypothetical protein BpHYR1_035424 [Brachionus plicatilis]
MLSPRLFGIQFCMKTAKKLLSIKMTALSESDIYLTLNVKLELLFSIENSRVSYQTLLAKT